jgi:hypothetical protein
MLYVKEGRPGETFTLICLRSVNILTSTNSFRLIMNGDPNQKELKALWPTGRH